MNAIPKKKLCWNCEGNVAREVDNCPYCGVYLHASEEMDSGFWNPSYRPSEEQDLESNIPSPPYQSTESEKDSVIEPLHVSTAIQTKDLASFKQLKQDLFPILFLMAGSIFFIFGLVVYFFSEGGTLTLQWKEEYGLYFLLLSAPLLHFGWRYLQQINQD